MHQRLEASPNRCCVLAHLEGTQAFDEAAERPDNADSSEQAWQVLKELRAQAAVDDELAVKVELRRDRRANGDSLQLTVALFSLDVKGVLVLLP